MPAIALVTMLPLVTCLTGYGVFKKIGSAADNKDFYLQLDRFLAFLSGALVFFNVHVNNFALRLSGASQF